MSNISEENSEFDFFISQSKPKSTFGTEYSYKAMNYYQQPVQHFLNFDMPSEQQQPELTGRMPEGTTKEMLKTKNRIKAKRFRDKKKHIAEMVQHKLKELECQNAALKQTKAYCGRCKTKIAKSKSSAKVQQQKPLLNLEFEPPQLEPEKTPKGKIWIALGIIMLIIGVNIHGFNKQPVQINLQNSFVTKLQKQLGSDSPSLKIPFSIKQKDEVFRQRPPDRKVEPSKQGVLLIQGGEQRQMVEVNKDFIVQLHAEINDIGNYL